MHKDVDYGLQAENYAALKDAFDCAGGPSEVARAFKLARQTVHGWKQCPPQYAIRLEELTGGQVPRHRLRPDIFGREGNEAKGNGTTDQSRKSE